MSKSSIGPVLDPSALDTSVGPRARLRIEVPSSWLVEGADLRITAPPRLTCARCDGGGCDACTRSGALRAPEEPRARVVLASLSAGRGEAVVLRIPRPFGEEPGIDQLLLEVSVAEAPSACVVRAPSAAPASIFRDPSRLLWPAFVLAVAATILVTLLGR